MALAFKPVAAPQLVQGAALLAALAGLATWGTLLWTPTPQPVPAAMQQTLSAPPAPAGQWFANLPAQVDISLSGLLAGSAGAVAIVSLNGGAPQAVRVGEQLAQGVQLVAIEADALVIERAGERSRIGIARLPEGPALPRLIRP